MVGLAAMIGFVMLVGLAEGVRPWRMGVIALAVVVVVGRFGAVALRREPALREAGWRGAGQPAPPVPCSSTRIHTLRPAR